METTPLVNPTPIQTNADDATIAFLKTVTVSDGATEFFYNANAPFAFKILWFSATNTSADGGTLTFHDGSNVICDITLGAVDKETGHVTSIDDAYSTIAKGGTVKCYEAGGGFIDCLATIYCIKV